MAGLTHLKLQEVKHPTKDGRQNFADLVGIDEQKTALVDELVLLLDRKRLDKWRQKHHRDGLPILDRGSPPVPLILLSGDVGCGKSALANCVASIVGDRLDDQVLLLETPSDIRGGGHVGELSARLTEAFDQAKAKASQFGRAILIIDEADDIATQRGQAQAHHEDRAGVNVLIKQLDQITREKTPLAVIMITNRSDVLDPAVLRRATLRLDFGRPDDLARARVFKMILGASNGTDTQIYDLVKATAKKPGYTYSDLMIRVARSTLRRCIEQDKPLDAAALKETIGMVAPSPLMNSA